MESWHKQAIHVNFAIVNRPEGIQDSTLSTAEQAGVARGENFSSSGMGYSLMHRTHPSTTGLILSSSPLALLA